MISKRRLVRIKAMEVLYAYVISKENIDKIKKDLLTELHGTEEYSFASGLIKYVIENQNILDDIIAHNINDWDYERISLIDKLLISLALAEMLAFPEIPLKVSINEAIELARMYSTAKSPLFVNAVLDSARKSLSKQNKIVKTGRGLINISKRNNEK